MTESSDQRSGPTDAGAMQPLASLPIFLRASGRRVVIAGGSDAAAWKAELFAAAAAAVEVYAQEPSERMRALCEARAGVVLHQRDWTPADLAGALVAIADAADDAEAEAFRAAGRAAGVPVNCIDRPAGSDFQFGAIVNRSPLVIAISTDGAAPVFAQAVRARIETIAPAGFAAWAQAARDWRGAVSARGWAFRTRRSFWEKFSALAFSRPTEPPREADRDHLIARAEAEQATEKTGKVYLVGAGPGDPELLTLRAVRALQSADVVLFDNLVSPAVLDFARREAERINVGKRGYKLSHGQDEICALLVELGGAGKNVVRLKGGDPSIFGRANEEIEAVQRAGIAVEIIPGVTAASGAAAALTVSLTEREIARRVQFVTAHSQDGRLPDDLDWSALADPRATTAVYMGVRTMRPLVEKLLAAGLAPDTPTVLVERATWADERVVPATLATICAATEQARPGGPCLVLIGQALARPAQRLADD